MFQYVGESFEIAHDTFRSELHVQGWNDRRVDLADGEGVDARDASYLLVDGDSQIVVGADAAGLLVARPEARKRGA